jgi:hypothetical protein
MSTTLSHFVNIKNTAFGAQSVGSSMNLSITKSIGRVEGTDNLTLSGDGIVSTHRVRFGYRWSFETEDISALNALNGLTTANNLVTTWIPAETQAGTPMASVLITLKQCVIDSIAIRPETKAIGKYTVSGHCIATSDDSDNFVMA